MKSYRFPFKKSPPPTGLGVKEKRFAHRAGGSLEPDVQTPLPLQGSRDGDPNGRTGKGFSGSKMISTMR